jgi:hypothetical protein
MPDIERLREDLEEAEVLVRRGAEQIRRQQKLIDVLERDGHSSGLARDVLATFEGIQETYLANRDRIAADLAAE